MNSVLVVDTSAVAVLTAEAGCEWILDRLASASECLMYAPTAVELGIVLEARVPAAVGITRRYPAGLNYGDRFTYALAEETGHPIVCVRDDFGRADISVVSAG